MSLAKFTGRAEQELLSRIAELAGLHGRSFAGEVRVALRHHARANQPPREEQAARISDGQRRAFHAKAGELARAADMKPAEAKQAALVEASRIRGRKLTSCNELTMREASFVLDWLEGEIEAAA